MRFIEQAGKRQTMARSLLAILAGAAASAAISTTLLFIWSGLMGGGADAGSLPLLLSAWVLVAFFANAVGALTLGLVWRWFAEKKGWRHALHYWLPGAICGFAVAFLFVNGGALRAGEAGSVWRWFGTMFPVYVYGAALGGFTAWFTWLIRRPDRDGANPDTATP